MVGQGTIVATGSIAYPSGSARSARAIGAEKVMTMTSTYDHRIIQGAESGRFLARIEALLQGEEGFYEASSRDLGVGAARARRRGPRPPAAAPPRRRRRPAAPRRRMPDEELLQAVAGRDLAAQGATARTATSRPGSTRSAASPRATRRSIPSRSA